ncbi:hypothetical protein DM01DRAFT_1407675 [Hesseltinella vesiculosa]|uniref:Cupredoxin n=1 Tax=Hesseltinella vesiculosa TaxID=101127 RepID=A0A1X2GGW1_9FUNG|nr:hypothetical protein DM01DRAFT_1407675 [Hesseltinella vesiculosa]
MTVWPLWALAIALAWFPGLAMAQDTVRYYEFNLTQSPFSPDCSNFTLAEAIMINNQVPAPSIHATLGDRIRILFRNQLTTATDNTSVVQRTTGVDLRSASIHFHGIHHHGSPGMDGVPFLTQNPVLPGESFLYDFKADQAGTFFYHAHVALQELTVFGALIIYESSLADPLLQPKHNTSAHASKKNTLQPRHRPPLLVDNIAYDDDHVLMLSEWFHRSDLDAYIAGPSYNGIPEADSILINGRFLSATNPPTSCAAPPPMLTVSKHQVIRLRVIGATVHRPMIVSIAHHQMTIVEMDGQRVVPFDTPVLEVSPGQRFSVMVVMDQPLRDYAISVTPVRASSYASDPAFAPLPPPQHGRAILRYESLSSSSTTRLPLVLPTANVTSWSTPWAVWDQLKPIHSSMDPQRKADVTILLNTTYAHEWRSDAYVQRFYTNGATYEQPHTTLLHQIWAGSRTALFNNATAASLAPLVTHSDPLLGTYPLKYGQLVDVVIQNTYYTNASSCSGHPWHTHGHSHQMIAYGPGSYNHSTDAGLRNVPRPILKDTTMVYPMFSQHLHSEPVHIQGCGWAKLRLMAHNPGLWMVHCHLAPHLLQGMAIVLEESIDRIQRPPL